MNPDKAECKSYTLCKLVKDYICGLVCHLWYKKFLAETRPIPQKTNIVDGNMIPNLIRIKCL